MARRRRGRRRHRDAHRPPDVGTTDGHAYATPSDAPDAPQRPSPTPPADHDPRPAYLLLTSMTITTWNTRALLTPDPSMHFRRWQHLSRIAGRSQVVCAQEVHSDDATMNDAAARLAPTHFAGHSACDHIDTGGVMTLIRHDFADAATMCHEVVLPGRITSTRVKTHQGAWVSIAIVHNHDVTARAARIVRERIRQTNMVSPPEYVFSLAIGTFRLTQAAGARRRRNEATQPQDARRTTARHGTRRSG